MKNKLMSLIIAAAMSVSLAACGGSSSDAASSSSELSSAQTSSVSVSSDEAGSSQAVTADGEYKISMILKTLSSEYFKYVEAGANQAAIDLGVTVDVKGPSSETAYDEQQNMIETDLNSGSYDAMIICPLQSDLVATIISGSDMTLLAVDTDIEAPEIISFVGTGNENAAATGAKAAVAAAQEAGWEEITCICLSGVQGDGTADDRLTGYEEGITEAGGTFLSAETQYTDSVADKAVTCMEAIMQNHPEGISIICGHNDDVIMAAARASKGNDAYANTIFLGFNGDKAACEAILSGEETMSVIQDAYGMGYKSVEAAVMSLNGAEIESFIDSGTGVVDISSASERLELLSTYLN